MSSSCFFKVYLNNCNLIKCNTIWIAYIQTFSTFQINWSILFCIASPIYFNSLRIYKSSLSPIRRGFAPGFVNYKKECTRLAAAGDKAYQLLGHGRWFSPGTPASSTTKTSHHDIAEILLKVALNTINQSIKSFSRVCVLIVKRQERFEDTNGVIRIRISKNRQHNGQKKKYKRTYNDLQNAHIKLKIE
jgi:hypothetical protein